MLLKTKDTDVQFIELAESELPAGGLRVTCEDENPKRTWPTSSRRYTPARPGAADHHACATDRFDMVTTSRTTSTRTTCPSTLSSWPSTDREVNGEINEHRRPVSNSLVSILASKEA